MQASDKSSGNAADKFNDIPSDLRTLPQWVCWKLELVENRLTKVPYNPSGSSASSTDPKTWGTFEQCLAAYRNGNEFSGVGFVFTDGNGLTGIDLDDHRDPKTGELDEFAKPIVARLASYTESSQSGTGVHIIARGVIPSDKGRRDGKQGVEMYSTGRFFVMTGERIGDTPSTIERRQAAVSGLFQEMFGQSKQEPKPVPATVGNLTLTDNELIEKASRAKNGAAFAALWRGGWEGAGYGSPSEADAALLGLLRFWTGGDKDRCFRLFSQSGLNRDKWEREDYRESTWALVANGDTYSPQSALRTTLTGTQGPTPEDRKPTVSASSLPAIIDAADFITQPIAEPPELIHGIIHRGSKLAIGGNSKSFKTWTLLDLALSVSTGKPWLGFETTAGRVLYVNFEIQNFSWKTRINAVAKARNITIEPGRLSLWNLRGKAANFNLLLPQIRDTVKDGFALIVLDPIYKLYGQTDENKASDVARLLNAIEDLTVETGAAVAFGAHFSKGNQAGKESLDRISGSGVFARDPDSLLTFTKHETEDAFTLDATLRNFPPVEPFVVRWQFPRFTPDGKLDPSKLKQAKGRKPDHEAADLLKLLPPGGLQNKDWLKAAAEKGISQRTYFRLKKTLEQTDKVIQSKATQLWEPINKG